MKNNLIINTHFFSGLGMGGAQQAMMMNPGAQNLAVAAAAAASMANMSMAEAAVVVQVKMTPIY